MKQYKGSQRCVLEFIESSSFIQDLNALLKSSLASITEADIRMPLGLKNAKEAQLKNFLEANFSGNLGEEIKKWWLAVSHGNTSTPNWDLLSTCTINGKKGLVLVEAKAHAGELENESKGKALSKDASANSLKNHEQIGKAIEEANQQINKKGHEVSISRDSCYQLSNRVAHAWWLANQGIPVVLLYLGFLNAEDMNDGKNTLLKSEADWENCFENHAKQVGVDKIIDKWVDCGESKFITICRSR